MRPEGTSLGGAEGVVRRERVEPGYARGAERSRWPRLRVRSAVGEVSLASFEWAAATDPLEAHTLEAVAAGSRRAGTLGRSTRLPSEVTERSTSRSAVSRRFVTLSSERLRTYVSLRAAGRARCPRGRLHRREGVCIVIALGVDAEGRKHVLGLREGAAETAAVATALLNDLVTRGLPTNRAMLFLIDGAPALRRAIRHPTSTGRSALFNAVRLHKSRHVLGPSAEAAARERPPGAGHGYGR